MGNQYFIEPQQSPILNFTNQLMHLKLAKEDQLLRQRGQEQAGQQFNIQQWGTPEAQPGMPTLHQRQVGAQEQQVANQTAQIPEHKKDFGSITAQAAVNEMTKLGVKKDNPLLGEIKGWATNKAINNERAYLTLKQNYGNYRDNIREEMAEDFVKKQEKDPNYGNTPEGRQHREVVGLLDNDETGDLVLGRYFGNTLKSMQMEEQNSKAALAELKAGFQSQLMNQKFEQWKELNDLKFQNQKELQDAKYNFLKDMKVSGAMGDNLGKKILQGAYQEQLRDVNKSIRELNPMLFENTEAFNAAKADLELRREDIMGNIKDLSGVPTKPKAEKPMSSMPSAAQNKGRTVRDTQTGKRYTSNGSSWVEVK